MTKILFLTHSPIGDYSYGGGQRANHLRNAMSAHGEVDTIIIDWAHRFSMDHTWSDLRSRSAMRSASGFSREAVRQRRAVSRWLDTIASEGRYDYIVVQYLDLARLMPRRWRSRMIYDPDDFLKTPPPGVQVGAKEKLRLFMRNALARRIASQARHVWYANPRPEQMPRNPRRSFMPNVVGVPDTVRDRENVVPYRLLMVGILSHMPNVEGLHWFATEVLPSLSRAFPATELHMVGRYEGESVVQLPGVVFRGFVEDLASEYDRAALVIAPIRFGGGTQIKVIDALMHRRPLVSSAFAHAGFAENLRDGEHLLVAQDANEWITACLRILGQPAEAEAMAMRGHDQVIRCYGPERMNAEVRATFDAVALRA